MTGSTSRLVIGSCVALGMAAVYWTTFSGPFPLTEFCTRRHPTWVFGLFESPRYTALTGSALLVALSSLAGLYLVGLWAARRAAGPLAVGLLLVGAPLLFGAILSPGYPLLSNDIFKYVFDGRILAVYHENPFVRVPADYPDDRFYDLVYWKAVVNAHGPLWRLLEAASAQIGGESCVRSILAMKAWPILAYALTTGTVYLMLRSCLPDQATFGAVAYAWNPLVLLETFQNGHNDVVAALPVLVALWLAATERWHIAFAALATAFLIKPLAALIGPILLIAAWRSGQSARRSALVGAVIAGVVVALAYLPFFGGIATLQGLERGDLFSASPAELVMTGLQAFGWPLDRAMAVARGLTGGVFAVLTVSILVLFWQGKMSAALAAPLLVLAYLLVGAQWFNPWYLLWLLPLAIVPLDRRVVVLALAFSLLAPLTYLLQYDSRLVVPVVFVPIAALAALLMARTRAARGPTAMPSPTVVAPGVVPRG